MKRFQDNLIKNLPDSYKKDKASNNYKLMQLLQYDTDSYGSDLEQLYESLDLEKAKGYTLKLYGDMVGQSKGLATDEQFKVLIRTKIARNRCTGSYPSIVDCICKSLNCEPSQIKIEEADAPCVVTLVHIPLKNVLDADFTPNQFAQIVNSLLPAGVTLEASVFEGTFEFADAENVASDTAGFCQNENDNTGGYFGVLSGSEAETVLPI